MTIELNRLPGRDRRRRRAAAGPPSASKFVIRPSTSVRCADRDAPGPAKVLISSNKADERTTTTTYLRVVL
jgi:hypothetical protein